MDYIKRLIENYPKLAVVEKEIYAAYEVMKDAYENQKKLLVCGNGGSAADSEHIVGELMKGFRLPRKLNKEEQEKFGELADGLQGALPAIALDGHISLSTAFSNDMNPQMVFAQQVYGYGRSGDIFLGISTSGNSENVIYAAKVAKAKGLKTIALLGRDGGVIKDLCDVSIIVPSNDTADIQELHLPIYHALCAMLEEYFWGEI